MVRQTAYERNQQVRGYLSSIVSAYLSGQVEKIEDITPEWLEQREHELEGKLQIFLNKKDDRSRIEQFTMTLVDGVIDAYVVMDGVNYSTTIDASLVVK